MQDARRYGAWSGPAMVGVAFAVSACAAGGSPGNEGTMAEPVLAADTAACVLARVPLTIGAGRYAYIEPEDLIQVGASYVVVGSPSYTWAPGTPGDSLPTTTNRHLAARFAVDGRATLIERPVQDSVGSVRSVALDGDRWGVLFDIERRRPSVQLWESVALWYAEHDGTRWSVLEPVPMPEDRELDINASSQVVRMADELVWVVAVRLPDQSSELVEYTRRDGGWRYRVISRDWVERSALAYDDGWGLWMAHFGHDAGLTRKALRLYLRDPEWRLVREAYVSSGGEGVANPALAFHGDGVSVSWRIVGAADRGAYALLGVGPRGGGTVLGLDREVLQVASVGAIDEAPRWLVTHANIADRTLHLRVLRPRSLFGAERILEVPSPYLGFLAALARTPREVLVVGPEVSSDPADPFVRSLILRLSTFCT